MQFYFIYNSLAYLVKFFCIFTYKLSYFFWIYPAISVSTSQSSTFLYLLTDNILCFYNGSDWIWSNIFHRTYHNTIFLSTHSMLPLNQHWNICNQYSLSEKTSYAASNSRKTKSSRVRRLSSLIVLSLLLYSFTLKHLR